MTTMRRMVNCKCGFAARRVTGYTAFSPTNKRSAGRNALTIRRESVCVSDTRFVRHSSAHRS